MKKLLSYLLVAVLLLTVVVGVPGVGPFGVDVVSAATGDTTPTTPTKPTTPKQTQATEITRILSIGSRGNDVKLLQTMLNSHGYKLKVDGVFGNLTLAAVKDYQGKNSLEVNGKVGPEVLAKLNPEKPTTLKVGRADFAAHGTKCFTSAVVVMAGDKIVAASLDDYQFMAADTSIGVPNSDKDFGTYYKDPARVLASKITNADAYSANMAKSGGATISIDKNLKAIEAYAIGKTVAELEKTLAASSKEQMVDAVSGATLTDTHGYVSAIVAAAKGAKEKSSLQVNAASLASIKMQRADYAAHGTKCFTSAVVAIAAGKIVAASLDDYQFMAKDTSIGVPNSDKDFGTYYKDPARVLGSKLTNADAYSANMAKSGGATISIDKNLAAIEAYAIGKTAIELEKTLAANSKEKMVDAVSGATLADTYGYVSAIVAAAKGEKQVKPSVMTTLKVGRVEYAAHGTKCFAVPVVVMAGDKIVAASIDEYQFMSTDVATGVPNSDKDFGLNYKDPKVVLAAKRANAKYYSEHMKEEAGSTVALDKNYDAIQAYVKGKTIAELDTALAANSKEQMVDAVSGATLADTHGYVSAIVAAAKAAKENSSLRVDVAVLDTLKVGRVEYAAHGTKCFAVPVVVMAGDKIVAASVDEYQFMSTDVATGVPNSDKDFGLNYKDPKVVLASKRTNAHYYSEHMKEEAGSTVALDKNYDVIQAYAVGKTVAELEKTLAANSKEQMVDAVSGATLADTHGYTSAIVSAAKAAK
jgi:Na+-transporting NADH:ubiquinone oxidoreductase subunit NqrC